uniref:Craniofacial development protein 2-like n=1 Tax=Nicotiana tabacum TaxID=4097 RepID=A0A1S4C5B6_TOBAC|nr:PREDICTED: uncharacterized protein LOC107815345 [Nicotiana tabacum]
MYSPRSERIIYLQLVVGEGTLNVVSAYAPQTGLDEDIKRHFWEGLDEIVRSIPPSERLFIGGDFNGHIGLSAGGYTEVHGRFGFGERNGGGIALLDFAKAFDLVIANSSFTKRDEHLCEAAEVVEQPHKWFKVKRELTADAVRAPQKRLRICGKVVTGVENPPLMKSRICELDSAETGPQVRFQDRKCGSLLLPSTSTLKSSESMAFEAIKGLYLPLRLLHARLSWLQGQTLKRLGPDPRLFQCYGCLRPSSTLLRSAIAIQD